MNIGLTTGYWLIAAALLVEPVLAQKREDVSRVTENEAGEVLVGDTVFPSWRDYFESGFFLQEGRRCGTAPGLAAGDVAEFGNTSDCSSSNTNPADEYSPSMQKYRIPVVFHILQHTNGNGFISDADVQGQINVLNQDFLAIPGTYGENGTDTQIEFFLAVVDPSGNPTTGITRTVNNSWYNDSGSYYNDLAWDTTRYLNIYTNTAGGYLGYAYLPYGAVGHNYDRVVLHWQTVGEPPAPYGPPYHLGRTATHEVGHHLGLYHTFAGGCGTSACYNTGDLICDTNQESSPNYSCFGATSCNSADPIDNYMNYTDDICMERFTPEQALRMRCVLENWRVDEGIIDCNLNGLPDSDDIFSSRSTDCQPNGIPDECDIADGTSNDCDLDGLPDECHLPPATVFTYNGSGINLDQMVATKVVVGGTWTATISPQPTRGSGTWFIHLRANPTALTFDLGSFLGLPPAGVSELLVGAGIIADFPAPAHGGGGTSSSFSTPVPANCNLPGLVWYAQGVVFGDLPDGAGSLDPKYSSAVGGVVGSY